MKERIRRLEERKKFFTMWYDRNPEICGIQLTEIERRLNLLRK